MKVFFRLVIIIFMIVVLMGVGFFIVDNNRINQNQKPKFCFEIGSFLDGGSKEYIGIGYKIIEFHRTGGYQETKIGTWFMKYEDYKEEYTKFEKEYQQKMEEQKLEDEKTNLGKGKLHAVIVKVYDSDQLLVMNIDKKDDIYYVSFGKNGDIGFKENQEVLIKFNGTILETYPAQIRSVSNIEILKESSDIEISDEVLKHAYSLKENVSVSVKELTKESIVLTIKDTNELPYEFADECKVLKREKNENYTGVPELIGEDTTNSTAPATRIRSKISMGRGGETRRSWRFRNEKHNERYSYSYIRKRI